MNCERCLSKARPSKGTHCDSDISSSSIAIIGGSVRGKSQSTLNIPEEFVNFSIQGFHHELKIKFKDFSRASRNSSSKFKD